MDEIKNAIKDLFSFDFNGEDVSDTDKADLVSKFNDIIMSDDEEVKGFVKSWFDQSLQLAKDNGLVSDETEETEEPVANEGEEQEEEDEEESEEKEESASVASIAPVQQMTMEQYTIKRANRFLLD